MADNDTPLGSPVPFPVSPQDRDLWIRTVIGEAGDDPSATAVANTIANRVASGKYGKSVSDIVTAPNQYETWSTPQGRKNAGVPANSPAYQNAAKIVDGIISGKTLDPTGGMTHFYAPIVDPVTGQDLSKNPPNWATGTPVRIGKQLFHAPQGVVDRSAATAIDNAAPIAIPQQSNRALAFSAGPAASMPKTNTPPKPQISDGDIDALMSGKSPPIASNSPPSSSISNDDIDKMMVAPEISPSTTPTQPKGSVTFLDATPGEGILPAEAKNITTGVVKGLGDVVGTVGNTGNLADYLTARIGTIGTGKTIEQSASDLQAANEFRKQHQTWIGKLGDAIDPRSWFPSGSDVSDPILHGTENYNPTTAFGQLYKKGVGAVVGPQGIGEYQPTNEFDRMLQSGVEATVGSFGPGARGVGSAPASVGRNLLARGIRAAVPTTLAGGASQAVTDATGDPLLGVAAAAAPALAMKGGMKLATKLGGQVDQQTAQLAAIARDTYKIPITAGQISSSPAVRYAASTSGQMPFSGAGKTVTQQQNAFNRAISHTMGQDADKITPTVMQTAKTALGKSFNKIAGRTNIKVDPQLNTDLQQVISDATSVLPPQEIVPLTNQINNLQSVIDPATNTISGKSYQALTRQGTPLDRAMSSPDPNIKYYASRIREALDDAWERSVTKYTKDKLQDTRAKWKAMKTIEDVVEKSTTGDMSPSLLMGRVRQSYGNMAYNGGQELGDLARIGQRFLKEPPNSGTAPREWWNRAFLGLGAAALGADKLGYIPPEVSSASIYTIPAALAASRGVSAALRSNWLTNSLINKSLGVPNPSVGGNLLSTGAPYALQLGRNGLPSAGGAFPPPNY